MQLNTWSQLLDEVDSLARRSVKDRAIIRELRERADNVANVASYALTLSIKAGAYDLLLPKIGRLIDCMAEVGVVPVDSRLCHGSDLIAMELGRTLIAERGKGTLTAKRITEMVDEAKGRMDGNMDRGGPVSVPPTEGVGRADGVRLHMERQGVPEGVNPLASMA